ncbi:MAG: T9SS type A sorting domain-containing protein [Saprospiraceae bacterium]|nr:T9SS type A sorting domain-containing protein [Saprospiraceae bacterium]
MAPFFTTSPFALSPKKLYCSFVLISLFHLHGFADVNLSTVTVGAGDVLQGTANNVVYILQLDVTGASAQLTNFSMVSAGNYAAADMDQFRLYRNTSPVFSGAINLATLSTPLGNGETVSFTTNFAFAVGTHYYRLQQVVFDGGTELSKTVSALVGGDGSLRIFPNPVAGTLHVHHSGAEVDFYTIKNSSGQLLLSGGMEDGQVDLSSVPAGIYFLLLKAGHQVLLEK